MRALNKLSIIVPVFNEVKTLSKVLESLADLKLPGTIEKELIIVDDGSLDGSTTIAEEFAQQNSSWTRLHKHSTSTGKGSALHSGITMATGEYMIIHDADLEYSPQDIPDLLQPIIDDVADVVYGTRFSTNKPRQSFRFYQYYGNRFLTWLSNRTTGLSISDMETCYKLLPLGVVADLELEENGFGFEPEITAKLSGVEGLRFQEVPISYNGRSYRGGKKITWRDGLHAVHCILKYRPSQKQR